MGKGRSWQRVQSIPTTPTPRGPNHTHTEAGRKKRNIPGVAGKLTPVSLGKVTTGPKGMGEGVFFSKTQLLKCSGQLAGQPGGRALKSGLSQSQHREAGVRGGAGPGSMQWALCIVWVSWAPETPAQVRAGKDCSRRNTFQSACSGWLKAQ